MTNLALTGPSGVGKSTLLAKIPELLPHKTVRGTTSQVIYEDGIRAGWNLHNYVGDGGVLAHLSIDSDYRLGRYGVDMDLFHRVMMPQLSIDPSVNLYLIDEVAAIAPWSDSFTSALDSLLDSDRPVIAIVGFKPRHPYPEMVKERDDVELWELGEGNRDQMLNDVLQWIDNQEHSATSPPRAE